MGRDRKRARKRGRGVSNGLSNSYPPDDRSDPSTWGNDPSSPRLDGDTKLDPHSISTDVPVESAGFGYVIPAGRYVVIEAYRRSNGDLVLLCRDLENGRHFHAFRDKGDPGPFSTDVGSYG